MTWQTLRCGKGGNLREIFLFHCLPHTGHQTCLQKQSHLKRYKEKLCLHKSEEDWSKSIPHFAGRLRPGAEALSRFIQHFLPRIPLPLTAPLLPWKKSLHQVLIKENQNVLRGKKTPKPQAQLLGLLPQHSGESRVALVSSSTWRASPHQDSHAFLFIPATPPCCGLIGFLHAETSYTASTGSFYSNLGTL